MIPLLLLASPLAAQPAPKLDDLAPHAAGVWLVEVVRFTTYDERAGDGNKGVRVKLKRVRGTGEFRDTIDIVTEHGGFRPIGPEPKPSAPVKPDSLKKGGRYWVAFSSEHEWEKYNEGVIAFWPEKAAATATLDAAVKADALRWSPQYDPETGLTYGHVVEPRQWRARVEKGGKVLWEKTIPGEKSDGSFSWGLWDNTGSGIPAKMPACGKLLIAETATELPAGNEYGLPAGTYLVNTGFDPETGKRFAAWVKVYRGPQVVQVNREYDPATGKPLREERFEVLKTGGKAVGAKTEEWYRKTARTFDPATGKATKEEVFRYDQEADPRWVKVRP